MPFREVSAKMVEAQVAPGQRLFSQRGAMIAYKGEVSFTPNMQSGQGGVMSMIGRRVAGEAAPPDGVRVLLAVGVEPNVRWRAFLEELFTAADARDVDAVVTLGALLADVPHTRPLRARPTSPLVDVRVAVGADRPVYEGPTGIIGVIADEAARRGLPSLSLWGTVPHYVAQAPSPKTLLGLVEAVEDLLHVSVSTRGLEDDARAWQRGVDELAAEDPDVAAYVRQLEEAQDTQQLPEASGESIAREFERYLRGRGGR